MVYLIERYVFWLVNFGGAKIYFGLGTVCATTEALKVSEDILFSPELGGQCPKK